MKTEAIAKVFQNHPWKFIGATYLLTSFFMIGLMNLKLENNIAALLSRTKGAAAEKQAIYDSYWKDYRASTFILKTKDGSDILSIPNFLVEWDFERDIMNTSFTFDGKPQTLSDYCVRMLDPQKGFSCWYDSATQQFPSRSAILSYGTDHQKFLNDLSRPVRGYCGLNVDVHDALGGDVWDNVTNVVKTAQSIKFVVYYQTDEGDEEKVRTMSALEAAFEDIANNYNYKLQNTPLTYVYATLSTHDRDLQRDIPSSIYGFIGGIFASWLVSLIGMRADGWAPKAILSAQALFNTALALGVSIGITSAAGLRINPISVQILPFFMFGIGNDNCFFIANTFAGLPSDVNERTRCMVCLKDGLAAMIISTLEMCLIMMAFLVIDLNLISGLAWMTTAALIANVIIQGLTFFPGLILISRRYPIVGSESHNPVIKYAKYWESWIFKPMRERPIVRYITIGFFVALTAVVGGLVSRIDINMQFGDIISQESMIVKFANTFDALYGPTILPGYLTVRGDYRNLNFRLQTLGLIDQVEVLPVVKPKSVVTFLKDLEVWSTFRRSKSTLSMTDGDQFMDLVNAFLADREDGGICYTQNVKLMLNNTNIDAMRVIYEFEVEKTLQEINHVYKTVGATVENKGLDITATGRYFVLSSAFDGMTVNYAISMAIIFGVFLLTHFFFYRAFWKLVVVTAFLLVLSEINVIGFYSIIGFELNPVTIANALLAIGIMVDYTGYMARVYTLYDSRDAEKWKLFSETVSVVTFGFAASLTSLLFLAFGKVPFVKQYFMYPYIMILTVIYLSCVFIFPVCLFQFVYVDQTTDKVKPENVAQSTEQLKSEPV